MERRKFVVSMAVAAGAASGKPKLAIDGGSPVRAKPLRADHWGPSHYDEKELGQVSDVIRSGNAFRWYGRPGTKPPNKVATFEREFAKRIGTKYSLAVSSGTAALQVTMAGLGIGPGDEVILPAWTWHSDATAVILAGALPVFAEIDESFNIDPTDIEHRITPRTKLIIAVHLQGVPADLAPILATAKKHGVPVLEDSAQCVGGSYKGRALGAWGAMGMFSHQVNKTISSGEGGSVVTSDPLLFERAVRFHDCGSIRPEVAGTIGETQLESLAGVNFRMSELCGGVMLEQTRKLDSIISNARRVVASIREGVDDLPGIRFRKEPDPAGSIGDSVYMEFTTNQKRDQFIKAMSAENVPARPPGGSRILPLEPYLMKKLTANPNWPTWKLGRGPSIEYGPKSCPRTLDIHSRFAGVGVDPGFSDQDIADVIAAIRRVYPTIAT
jgi:8-amino-3,8-dideoxy-alpha-D-manno-octulosonate transaminase